MSRRLRCVWGDAETDFLVSERRRRNYEYHFQHRGDKTEFWASVARRIHRRYRFTYTAQQCERKWRNLIRDYGVSTKTTITVIIKNILTVLLNVLGFL